MPIVDDIGVFYVERYQTLSRPSLEIEVSSSGPATPTESTPLWLRRTEPRVPNRTRFSAATAGGQTQHPRNPLL